MIWKLNWSPITSRYLSSSTLGPFVETGTGTFDGDETDGLADAVFVAGESAAFNEPTAASTTSPVMTATVECKMRINPCCRREPATADNLRADGWFKQQFIWGGRSRVISQLKPDEVLRVSVVGRAG